MLTSPIGQLEALTQRAFPQDSSSKNHIHRPRGEANRKMTIRKSTGRARLGFNLQTASRLPLEQYKAYEVCMLSASGLVIRSYYPKLLALHTGYSSSMDT